MFIACLYLHFCVIFFQFFLCILNRSIYGTLTGTTTLGQSGSGSNDNERGISQSYRFPELEPYH